MLIHPDSPTQILEMSIPQGAGSRAPWNMLGLLQVHMMYQSDSANWFPGPFGIFWMKITSPTLKVEDILCKAQKELIVNHWLILHGKKKSEEAQGHLEKTPVPAWSVTDRFS